jgi:hypothetical protein
VFHTTEVQDMKSRSRAASASIQLYNEVMASYANKRRRSEEHQAGDLVLLSTKFFKPPVDSGRARKLAPKFAGPYKSSSKSPLRPTNSTYRSGQTRTPSCTPHYSRPTSPTPRENALPLYQRPSRLTVKLSTSSKQYSTNASAEERGNIWSIGPATMPTTRPGNRLSTCRARKL